MMALNSKLSKRKAANKQTAAGNREPVKMKNLFSKFLKDESGATAIEYGLLAALIAVGIITVVGQVGDNLTTTFTSVKDGLAPK